MVGTSCGCVIGSVQLIYLLQLCMSPSMCSDAIKLAEGLETPEFWSLLGGKGEHTYIRPAEVKRRGGDCVVACIWQ